MNNTKNLAMLHSSLKDMKKVLSSKCTFLSVYTHLSGEVKIKAIIHGETWLLTTPRDLAFSKADWEQVLTTLNEKCNQDVRK